MSNMYNEFKKFQDKAEKYSFIDKHTMGAMTTKIITEPLSKETLVTVWILGLPILLVALLVFIFMLPMRLFADIKLIFCDIIIKLENK